MTEHEQSRQELLFPPPVEAPKGRRLLVLSCSDRKSPAIRAIPAFERYDGPAFRVLRRFRDNAPVRGVSPPALLVISAKHGLVNGDTPIRNYDERLTDATRRQLRCLVLQQLAELPLEYDYVLVSTSRAYEAVIEGIEEHFPASTSVIRTRGPRGKQLAQLRNWLEAKPIGLHVPEHRFPRQGVARLKGIERSLTTAEVMQFAHEWLEEDRRSSVRSPWRFLDRYVLVGGERVAPKWLVGRIFELPVASFETPDARRVLEQLGIRVYALSDST